MSLVYRKGGQSVILPPQSHITGKEFLIFDYISRVAYFSMSWIAKEKAFILRISPPVRPLSSIGTSRVSITSWFAGSAASTHRRIVTLIPDRRCFADVTSLVLIAVLVAPLGTFFHHNTVLHVRNLADSRFAEFPVDHCDGISSSKNPLAVFFFVIQAWRRREKERFNDLQLNTISIL